MKLFIFIGLLTLSLSSPALLNKLSPLIQHFHEICFTLQPQKISQPEIWRALVCGENLSSKSSIKSELIFTQLIHLIVVSGAHFLILLQILLYIGAPGGLSAILLIIFAVGTGFQAPSVRGLIMMALSMYSSKYKVIPHSDQRALLVVLICFLLQPLWINSWSLYLSSLCALALSFQSIKISTHSMVFLFIFPLETLWSSANPLGLLTNYLLADFIGLILFPVALLAIIPVHFFEFPFNFLTQIFLKIINLITSEFNFHQGSFVFVHHEVPFSFWIYQILLFSMSHYLRLKRFSQIPTQVPK